MNAKTKNDTVAAPVSEAAAKTDVKHVTEKKKQGNVMYLGPTITGVIRHSINFKDGVLPDKVKECVDQFPAMKQLFVSTDEIPAAVKELSKAQSALKTIYSQVSKKFN